MPPCNRAVKLIRMVADGGTEGYMTWGGGKDYLGREAQVQAVEAGGSGECPGGKLNQYQKRVGG